MSCVPPNLLPRRWPRGLLPHLSEFQKKKTPKSKDIFIPLIRRSGKFVAGPLSSDSAARGRLRSPWLRGGAEGKGSLTESCPARRFLLPLSVAFPASPGQWHAGRMGLRAVKRCCQSWWVPWGLRRCALRGRVRGVRGSGTCVAHSAPARVSAWRAACLPASHVAGRRWPWPRTRAPCLALPPSPAPGSATAD